MGLRQARATIERRFQTDFVDIYCPSFIRNQHIFTVHIVWPGRWLVTNCLRQAKLQSDHICKVRRSEGEQGLARDVKDAHNLPDWRSLGFHGVQLLVAH